MLPDELAEDAERLGRFAREARILASLNHQNIAHVYGFEQSGRIGALVMELVDGPTLPEVIDDSRHPAPGPAHGTAAGARSSQSRARSRESSRGLSIDDAV